MTSLANLIVSVRETFLTDAVLLGNSLANIWRSRSYTVGDRSLSENGLEEPTLDEFGNASGIIPGSSGEIRHFGQCSVDSVLVQMSGMCWRSALIISRVPESLIALSASLQWSLCPNFLIF